MSRADKHDLLWFSFLKRKLTSTCLMPTASVCMNKKYKGCEMRIHIKTISIKNSTVVPALEKLVFL